MEIISFKKLEDPQLVQFLIWPLGEQLMNVSLYNIPDEEIKVYSQIEFQAYVDKKYELFHTIFTDGSKIREPSPSVASANCAINVPHVKWAIC